VHRIFATVTNEQVRHGPRLVCCETSTAAVTRFGRAAGAGTVASGSTGAVTPRETGDHPCQRVLTGKLPGCGLSVRGHPLGMIGGCRRAGSVGEQGCRLTMVE
jgi:hypothetical protein